MATKYEVISTGGASRQSFGSLSKAKQFAKDEGWQVGNRPCKWEEGHYSDGSIQWWARSCDYGIRLVEDQGSAHRSKGKHRAGGRTAKEQALRDVEAAGIRYVRAGMPQPNPDRGYERALTAAWKARATGTEIQAAMARGEARAGRHKARGRHR